jgi:hypothetical protein
VARNSIIIVLFVRAKRFLRIEGGPWAGQRLLAEPAQSNTLALAAVVVLGIASVFAPRSYVIGGLTGLLFERAVRARLMREAAIQAWKQDQ